MVAVACIKGCMISFYFRLTHKLVEQKSSFSFILVAVADPVGDASQSIISSIAGALSVQNIDRPSGKLHSSQVGFGALYLYLMH